LSSGMQYPPEFFQSETLGEIFQSNMSFRDTGRGSECITVTGGDPAGRGTRLRLCLGSRTGPHHPLLRARVECRRLPRRPVLTSIASSRLRGGCTVKRRASMIACSAARVQAVVASTSSSSAAAS
jgi:microcystin degradation protein MlrC